MDNLPRADQSVVCHSSLAPPSREQILPKYQEEIDEGQAELTTGELRCESSTGSVADGFDSLAGQTAEVTISASEGQQQSTGREETVRPAPGSAESDGAEPEILMCIECEDQHAELMCLTCDEPFCRPCWASLHRYVPATPWTIGARPMRSLSPSPTFLNHG